MRLVLDVGNTTIFGGVFDGDKLKTQFRKASQQKFSSDELGVFLRSVLHENGVNPTNIDSIGVCSVVPSIDHSIKNACVKYFRKTPFFVQAGVRTGLRIRYHNPHEVGADRIATAVAGVHRHPGQNLVIIDFGTAITFCAVTAEKDYLGGVILAGVGISAEALEQRTARLPAVEIMRPKSVVGRATVESIQSGLYYGTLGATREIVGRITAESFDGKHPRVIGTGGFAGLFAEGGVFDEEAPNLVLEGIYLTQLMNSENTK